MKIRTIMAAMATGILLTSAGSTLTFGAEWVCPRGDENCQGYEYCTTHEHGDCSGYWSENGDWVCPDGTHSYCVSASSDKTSTRTGGHGHHSKRHGGNGCGSHHN